jgi:hypothetical protein
MKKRRSRKSRDTVPLNYGSRCTIRPFTITSSTPHPHLRILYVLALLGNSTEKKNIDIVKEGPVIALWGGGGFGPNETTAKQKLRLLPILSPLNN